MKSPSASGPRAKCGGAHSSYRVHGRANHPSLKCSCRTARSVANPPVALTIARTLSQQLSDGHAEAFDKSQVVRSPCPPACPVRRLERVWTSIHSLPILAAGSRRIALHAAPPSYSGAASRVELIRVSADSARFQFDD